MIAAFAEEMIKIAKSPLGDAYLRQKSEESARSLMRADKPSAIARSAAIGALSGGGLAAGYNFFPWLTETSLSSAKWGNTLYPRMYADVLRTHYRKLTPDASPASVRRSANLIAARAWQVENLNKAKVKPSTIEKLIPGGKEGTLLVRELMPAQGTPAHTKLVNKVTRSIYKRQLGSAAKLALPAAGIGGTIALINALQRRKKSRKFRASLGK
jgi:hypothetical protein